MPLKSHGFRVVIKSTQRRQASLLTSLNSGRTLQWWLTTWFPEENMPLGSFSALPDIGNIRHCHGFAHFMIIGEKCLLEPLNTAYLVAGLIDEQIRTSRVI
ncbi:MAG: hypothetical protein N0E59_18695 [Candidatus Thiodiazotropha taylori]|nr:hypothetical protein [Candidatus Thiodiazotropha taylori]MCG8108952.1 hypothetical protein [Candidatus Thiodiazotropha taylori]MCG8112790.1 hypothetical protein [Candidatus Thiodiazotropha taylori]MCW4281288.1 hypothetical protein [Candidatus Thiodiazotropha taylori]MCW4285148.1 hypothetical protein [Candidatus Thiodiazotropha taylori]